MRSPFVALVFIIVLFGETCEGTTPNIGCMMLHCAEESLKCMEDHDCRSTLSCLTGCGQNNTCMFDCLYSYEDDIFDTFMRCASTKYDCIKLDPPNPPVTCHPPSQVVQNFTFSNLEGSWYIVKGLNRLYDCFDCQRTTFVPDQTSKNVMKVNELFDVHTVEGTIRHRSVNETVTQTKTAGILQYSSTQMGHNTISEWRVLDYGQGGDYIFMYYCGSIAANYFYEGSVVYSKSPALSQEALNSIQQKATALGFNFNNYCTTKNTGCQFF